MCNWQLPDWPDFICDRSRLEGLLTDYQTDLSTHLELLGKLPESEQYDIHLATSVEEGVRSAAIEGEQISREDVRSSLLNTLRFGPGCRPVHDLRARGVANLLREATREPGSEVTETSLLYWHELLFRGQSYPGQIGQYRSSSAEMQIVSGPLHRPAVHFIAPPVRRIPEMMRVFFELLDRPLPVPLRAGLAHLHFESIHPFADGNGRIGRALLERMLLAPFGGLPIISISHAIQLSRPAYYTALRDSQRSLDATPWLRYLLTCCREAVHLNQELTRFTLLKVAFFQRFGNALSSKQEKALLAMWSAGPDGFRGGMSTKKYVRITRVSPATASRDLRRLVELGALKRTGAGRTTRYELLGGY